MGKVHFDFIPRKTYKDTFYISAYRKDMTGDYYPAADYEALERRLEEWQGIAKDHAEASANATSQCIELRQRLEAAEQHNRGWVDRCRRFREQDAEEAQRRLAEAEAERDRLREALEEIMTVTPQIDFRAATIERVARAALRREGE